MVVGRNEMVAAMSSSSWLSVPLKDSFHRASSSRPSFQTFGHLYQDPSDKGYAKFNFPNMTTPIYTCQCIMNIPIWTRNMANQTDWPKPNDNVVRWVIWYVRTDCDVRFAVIERDSCCCVCVCVCVSIIIRRVVLLLRHWHQPEPGGYVYEANAAYVILNTDTDGTDWLVYQYEMKAECFCLVTCKFWLTANIRTRTHYIETRYFNSEINIILNYSPSSAIKWSCWLCCCVIWCGFGHLEMD